jgi:TonB family protein
VHMKTLAICLAMSLAMFTTAMPGTPVRLNPEWLTYCPKPQYPYEARSRHIQGSGIFVLHVHGDIVTKVDIYRSTGSPILDNTAVSEMKRWQFKPNTPVLVVVPITYTMVGGNGNVRLPPGAKPFPPRQ